MNSFFLKLATFYAMNIYEAWLRSPLAPVPPDINPVLRFYYYIVPLFWTSFGLGIFGINLPISDSKYTSYASSEVVVLCSYIWSDDWITELGWLDNSLGISPFNVYINSISSLS